MQLAERELAELSSHLTDAEEMLARLPQKPLQVTAELGRTVIRSALLALDDSAQDVSRAARTLQNLRSALAGLNVPSEVHEHVCRAFKVLGGYQQDALGQVEISCLADARYRQQSLKAELQGVRAELAGEDPCAALEPARRAQMIVEELSERPGPPALATDSGSPGLRHVTAARSPQQTMAALVSVLGG